MVEEKDKYELGLGAEIDLVMFGDWQEVAKDLENMVVGQECFLISNRNGRDIVKRCRNQLNRCFKDKREDYKLTITQVGMLYSLSVKRIK